MTKLIARELDVPITQLLEMPEHYCQSCGMMFTAPDQYGHEVDGSETKDYCRWCYEGGKYTYETTMDDMIEECAPRMAEAMDGLLTRAHHCSGQCCRRLNAGSDSDTLALLLIIPLNRHG